MDAAQSIQSILIVEDDQDICELLGIVLRSQGYSVLAAGDGARALELLRDPKVHPFLILLDLRMPVMNGWQFRDQQLRDPQLASIPVVVMTADRSEAARTGVSGAAACLAKPLELQELRRVVARFAHGD